MDINNEQLRKLIDLAAIDVDFSNISSDDINKALISIERKLLSFGGQEAMTVPAEFNILIVDDLELSIYQFNQLLKKVGIVPTVARNKEEALAELKKKKFDYIVVDLFLPDAADGIELIDECIKLRDAKRTNKIIVMSGTDDKNLIEKCYKLGIDEFVPKNSNWHDQILKFITSSLTSKQHEDFFKYSINDNICCYTINKFNARKHIDMILKDVTTSLYTGYTNIIFNMENVKIFDDEYTSVFAELYKMCNEKKGQFMLVKISESLREALSDAFLDTLIPTFSSVDVAVSKIESN
ncbi:MAG: response regulator [Clostridium sp.]|nr:response regulator [Clostridium sp.]